MAQPFPEPFSWDKIMDGNIISASINAWRSSGEGTEIIFILSFGLIPFLAGALTYMRTQKVMYFFLTTILTQAFMFFTGLYTTTFTMISMLLTGALTIALYYAMKKDT
jgi:predicted membrane protein